jgi:hypothetical protein
MGRKDSGLGGDRGKENRSGEEGLIVGRAAWDSAGSRMPFASGGQDIGQAIKSADGAATMALLRFVMGTAPGARGAWQSRQQRAESRQQTAESREQRAESREQRAESREQRAESREQRAESRAVTTW